MLSPHEAAERTPMQKVCGTLLIRFIRENWGTLLFGLGIAMAMGILGIVVFEPLSWEAWFSVGVTIILLMLLIKDYLPIFVVFLLGLTVLTLFKIITVEEALAGFSNEAVWTVLVLFFMAEGVRRTTVLEPIFRIIFGNSKIIPISQLRIMIPLGIISAFLNNTPIVAMMIPTITTFSRNTGIPPSKIFMPMNLSVVLGGTLTLIGTSTNLVVVGLAQDAGVTDREGNEVQFTNIFEIGYVGIFYFLSGLIYTVIFSPCLLPVRHGDALSQIQDHPRKYTVALTVKAGSPVVGKSVQEAGLRNLTGLFLVEIIRSDGEEIPAPGPEAVIKGGDTLTFAGVVETVKELYQITGLEPATASSQKINVARHNRRLYEVVIARSSSLVGKSVRESRFRSTYHAAIIAAQRNGEVVQEKIGDIIFAEGDVLLVEAGPHFKRFRHDPNFAVIVMVSGSERMRTDWFHRIIAVILVVVALSLSIADVLPLVVTAAGASLLMIATGCMTMKQAAKAAELGVVIAIAGAFGFSTALEKTGVAAALSDFIVRLLKPLGQIGIIFAIYVVSAVLSEIVTNNAAAALMFPIVASPGSGIVDKSGVAVYAALYALMLGSSAGFNTPIGYQTNMMIHGPGGYKFYDWPRFGLILSITLAFTGSILCYFIYTK